MCSKVQNKILMQATLSAELVKVSSTVLVQNIERDDIDEELLKLYFNSPIKSGGSSVEAVRLIGDGKAVVTFGDPKGNNNAVWGYKGSRAV